MLTRGLHVHQNMLKHRDHYSVAIKMQISPQQSKLNKIHATLHYCHCVIVFC